MRVAVAVKAVAEVDDEFELVDGRVDPDFIDRALNEWDSYAIEAALALAGGEDDEVVLFTWGDEDAEDVLLQGLAMGADRAVRIESGDEEAEDPLRTARVLAAAVEPERFDLVLTGAQSADAAFGATGVALAALLGLPRVALAKRIAASDGTLEVDRELAGGAIETVRLSLPALLTVQTGANSPRYANLRAIKGAREKPRAVVDAAAAGPAPRVTMSKRARGDGAEMLTGGAEEVAGRLLALLDDRLPARS